MIISRGLLPEERLDISIDMNELRDSGVMIKEIAQRYRCSVRTVSKHIKELRLHKENLLKYYQDRYEKMRCSNKKASKEALKKNCVNADVVKNKINSKYSFLYEKWINQ